MLPDIAIARGRNGVRPNNAEESGGITLDFETTETGEITWERHERVKEGGLVGGGGGGSSGCDGAMSVAVLFERGRQIASSKFGSLKVAANSSTPYSDATQCRKQTTHVKRPMNAFMVGQSRQHASARGLFH